MLAEASPSPNPIPSEPDHSHQILLRAAGYSVWASALLTAGKLVAGLSTNSLGLLSEALHGLIDLVATSVTFLTLKVSRKPADREHHFGHGKFESVAALGESVLLWGICVWVLWEGVSRLLQEQHSSLEANIWVYLLLLVSVVVDLNRSTQLQKLGTTYDSPALLADALHFRNDLYLTILVLAGLLLSSVGLAWADILAGFLVALWTFRASLVIARNSFDQLTDRAPPNIDIQIRGQLQTIAEIPAIKSLKVRKAADQLFIELVLGLDREISLLQAHQITDLAEAKLRQSFPRAAIIIHPEPL